MLSAMLVSMAVTQTLPAGAVGGAFLKEESEDSVVLVLRFDQSQVDGAPPLPEDNLPAFRARVKAQAPVTLFDAKGRLVSLTPSAFTYRFSCENDGGIRAQAVAEVKVAKSALSRALRPAKKAWNVVGFALVGKKKLAALTPEELKQESVYAKADLDGDSAPDSLLSIPPDDAMNCEDGKSGQGTVNLVTHDHFTALRCCGP